MTIHVSAVPYFSSCLPALEGRISEALEERRKMRMGVPDGFNVTLRLIDDDDARLQADAILPNDTHTYASTRKSTAPPGREHIAAYRSIISIYAVTCLANIGNTTEECATVAAFHNAVLRLLPTLDCSHVEDAIVRGENALAGIDRKAQAWRADRGIKPILDDNYLQKRQTAASMLPAVRDSVRALAAHITHHLSHREDVFSLRHELDHVDFHATPVHVNCGHDPRFEWLSEARAFCVSYTQGRGFMARLRAANKMRETVRDLYVAHEVKEEQAFRESDKFGNPDEDGPDPESIKRAGRRAIAVTRRVYIHAPSRLRRAGQEATSFEHYCNICEGIK